MYLNLKDHLMNNDAKPTARGNPHRTPPFPIQVDLPASADTIGGRLHAALEAGAFRYKLGMDAYRLWQSATQTVSDRDTGQIHHNMHPVWPDAEMTNVGAYGQVLFEQGRSTIGGTVRVDREQAQIGQITSFFAHNAIPGYELNNARAHFHCVMAHCMPQMGGHGAEGPTSDMGHMAPGHSQDGGHGATTLVPGDQFGQTNANISAAANASLRVTDTWLVNLGVGRAVRNPSVLERYADRFPAVKFQTAAEFVGNPNLVPEKSPEFNAGTTFRAVEATVGIDFFVRHVDDYITVAPDPNLQQRLPLSPETLYRYVQEDAARFTGFDLTVSTPVGAWIDVRGGWSYVQARDMLFHEPLFGVPPFEQQYAIELHYPTRVLWFELQLTSAAAQNRVAAARAGYTRLDDGRPDRGLAAG